MPHEVISLFGSSIVLRFLWAFLTVGLLKGGVLVLAAYALTRTLRRSPEAAHAIWFVALLGLFILPVAWLLVPPVAAAAGPRTPGPGSLLLGAAPLFSQDRMLGLTNTSGGFIALSRQVVPGGIPPAARILAGMWAAGTSLLLCRLLLGSVYAARLAARGEILRTRRQLLETLRTRLCIKRELTVVASRGCAIPFTFGMLRPRVVVPADVEEWDEPRLRAVLLHELAHVKRFDCILNLLSGVLVSLLWCLPFAWMAVSQMRRAQEASCDRRVLGQGVAAAAYASQILHILRKAQGRILSPGLESSFGRKSMARERIKGVLALGKDGPGRPLKLAARVLLVAFCCLLPLLAVTCASSPAAAGQEKLNGTWENKEYFGSYWTHTFVNQPGGREVWYDRSDIDSPTGESRYVIDKKWVDPQGNTWYRTSYKWCYMPFREDVASANGTLYALIKIDPAGNLLEIESSTLRWPESFGSLGSHHYTYYRKL